MEYVPKELYVKNKTRPIIIAVVVLSIFLLISGVDKALAIIFILAGILAISYFSSKVYPARWNDEIGMMARQAREIDEQQFKEEVSKHLSVLARKRNILITQDDYGNVIKEKWIKEKEYYLSKLRYIPNSKPYYSGIDLMDQSYILEELIDSYAEDNPIKSQFDENLSPIEYEHLCADILREQGWEARVTQGSGDQGVDVLAIKDGMMLAVQCKKYSSPVGNKAVQEVIAGVGFYGANRGAVVTNNTYTPSARQLASSHNILLLHHDDLQAINDLF
ncbi:TPA: restriction endonuclease [Kluyvera georgiana]|nr:restriction endonuclease [Kluyvera georgiana]